MAKTLLQLINEVGKNVKLSTGSTFTTITQDADAVFITQMINEAKRMVEDEWDWDVLRTEISFSTVVSTQTYDTSDLAVVTSDPDVTNDRSKLIKNQAGGYNFYDVTSGDESLVRVRSRSWVKHQRKINTDTVDTAPSDVAIYKNADGLVVEFPYSITSVRDYTFEAKVPQAELADAATELTINWRPVVMAATALVAEERGEELGLTASTWWERYNSNLSAALVDELQLDVDSTLVSD